MVNARYAGIGRSVFTNLTYLGVVQNYIRPTLALLTLGLMSCSDQTTVFIDDLQSNLVLEENRAVLQNAIRYEESGVLDIYEENALTGKAGDVAGDYPLTLIATVAPPSYQSGDNLTASHVDLAGNYAFVAYNTVGEMHYGGIDVVDVSDPHNPRVTSRLFYLNADINALQYDNGYVYVAGGLDSETSVNATSNSFVARVPVNGGIISADFVEYGFQPGYNATDLLVETDRILVTSGKEGSLTAYSKTDLGILKEAYVADARSMASTSGRLAVLDAGTGVRMLDMDFNETFLIPVATDLGEATKKTIAWRGSDLLVSEAGQGAGLYDATTGQLLEYLPIPIHPDGIDQVDVVTNAVTVNDKAVFMANGGAGMSLSEKSANGAELVGIIELSGSVNYVASKGDYVFAASGKGGLQIIKLNRPGESLAGQCAGLPEYDGSNQVVINETEDVAYSGSKSLNSVAVGGRLLLCGSWTVSNHVNLQPGGTLDLYGALAVGQYKRRRNIVVNEGSTLRIEGDVTIYGDLILNDGASVEFLGSGSVLDVFGSVKITGEVSVTGTFRDVRERF